uniref:Secreted protein n=1 Tax=Parascaris univalens TaxID=6257 RepID=A0A915BDN8_PARUN
IVMLDVDSTRHASRFMCTSMFVRCLLVCHIITALPGNSLAEAADRCWSFFKVLPTLAGLLVHCNQLMEAASLCEVMRCYRMQLTSRKDYSRERIPLFLLDNMPDGLAILFFSRFFRARRRCLRMFCVRVVGVGERNGALSRAATASLARTLSARPLSGPSCPQVCFLSLSLSQSATTGSRRRCAVVIRHGHRPSK